MDIHKLDGTLNDPNRALSDLRNDDGFAYFIESRKNAKRNMEIRLDIEELFDIHKDQFGETITLSVGMRQSPSTTLKQQLQVKFKNRCNITGYKLHEHLDKGVFLKNLQLVSYDHRVPLSKDQTRDQNKIENWQILSELVNREKNKLCNSCSVADCDSCALAYPEESNIIIANNQDISSLMQWRH